VGRGGSLVLDTDEIEAMLRGGASWAVGRGLGRASDLSRTEESGRVPGADPAMVSDQAKTRVRDQIGSLGSGNHYLEVQCVEEILDAERAEAFGLAADQAVLSVHCGSRGLGHQIGRDYMARMKAEAKKHGLRIKDPELACAPVNSDLGRAYLGAMRCGINCALANRQAITHLARQALDSVFPGRDADLLYDVSHNTCKQESGLFVHRKGATRAFGPGHPELPRDLARAGQPVLVGGSMGTASYVLAGLGCADAFASAPHGAGRALSRTAARKRFKGRDLLESLRHQGVLVRTASFRGVAEEAPDAYKDVEAVVRAAETAGLIRVVARLKPMICVKG
jgi:tRNA-splicing ligase RtcB